MIDTPIVVAGASGDLGLRIVKALRTRGAEVRALVRESAHSESVTELERTGARVIRLVAYEGDALVEALRGARCVVSALSGLGPVILDTQTRLLDAAVLAGVQRFIPSDYCIDYFPLAEGSNRNLDLRRAFSKIIATRTIKATSIFNGAFADMLAGQMPLVLPKIRRVLFWGDADQKMDFTTKDNVAEFTAAAAMDAETPRFLRIAGDQVSPRDLVAIAGKTSGEDYRLLRPGGLGLLATMIGVIRRFTPKSDDLYPAWQGMQYMHNMLSGVPKLHPLDNARYPGIAWTGAADVLAAARV